MANHLPTLWENDFTEAQLKALDKRFHEIAGDDNLIDYMEMREALGETVSELTAQRIFASLDTDNSGKMSITEFIEGMHEICSADWKDQAKFIFHLFDKSGDNVLDAKEFEAAIKKAADLSALNLPESTANKLSRAFLTASLVKALDVDGNGSISLSEFVTVLEKNPHLRRGFEFRPLHFLMKPVPPRSKESQISSVNNPVQSVVVGMNSRILVGFSPVAVCWVAMYFAASSVLVYYTVIFHQRKGAPLCIQVARAAGANLNFHAVLLAVTMLRKHSYLFSHSNLLSNLLPLTVTIPMHRSLGIFNFIWIIIHTAGHFSNYRTSQLPSLFSSSSHLSGLPGVEGTAYVTGVVLLGIACLMAGGYYLSRVLQPANKSKFSVSCAFELFLYSHYLALPYVGVMFIHADTCWKWLCGPVALLIGEWTIRFIQSRKETAIVEVELLPSNVIKLAIERTKSFHSWSPAAYAFVKIPAISREWHPFTISSSSERPDKAIVFHIRGVTEDSSTWSGKLINHFRVSGIKKSWRVGEPLDVENGKFSNLRASSDARISPMGNEVVSRSMAAISQMKVYLHGPYGVLSQQVFSCPHSVVVAAGIGVTPAAAILDFVYQKCKGQDCAPSQIAGLGKLQRLDFIWLNRDFDCTEWFTPLIASIEEEKGRFPDSPLAELVHTHIYLTSLPSQSSQDIVSIHMAIDVLAGADVSDIVDEENWNLGDQDAVKEYDENSVKLRPSRKHPIIGLSESVNVHPGKPQWTELLGKLKGNSPKPDSLTVFFCGPTEMGSVTACACGEIGVRFRLEVY